MASERRRIRKGNSRVTSILLSLWWGPRSRHSVLLQEITTATSLPQQDHNSPCFFPSYSPPHFQICPLMTASKKNPESSISCGNMSWNIPSWMVRSTSSSSPVGARTPWLFPYGSHRQKGEDVALFQKAGDLPELTCSVLSQHSLCLMIYRTFKIFLSYLNTFMQMLTSHTAKECVCIKALYYSHTKIPFKSH